MCRNLLIKNLIRYNIILWYQIVNYTYARSDTFLCQQMKYHVVVQLYNLKWLFLFLTLNQQCYNSWATFRKQHNISVMYVPSVRIRMPIFVLYTECLKSSLIGFHHGILHQKYNEKLKNKCDYRNHVENIYLFR